MENLLDCEVILSAEWYLTPPALNWSVFPLSNWIMKTPNHGPTTNHPTRFANQHVYTWVWLDLGQFSNVCLLYVPVSASNPLMMALAQEGASGMLWGLKVRLFSSGHFVFEPTPLVGSWSSLTSAHLPSTSHWRKSFQSDCTWRESPCALCFWSSTPQCGLSALAAQSAEIYWKCRFLDSPQTFWTGLPRNLHYYSTFQWSLGTVRFRNHCIINNSYKINIYEPVEHVPCISLFIYFNFTTTLQDRNCYPPRAGPDT